MWIAKYESIVFSSMLLLGDKTNLQSTTQHGVFDGNMTQQQDVFMTLVIMPMYLSPSYVHQLNCHVWG